LLEYLPEFCQLYPEITLNIEYSENTTGITEKYGDIHFAYPIHQGVTDEMRYRYLFKVKHMLSAAPSYLKKHRSIKTTKDLLAHQYINLDLRDPLDAFSLANGKTIAMPKPYLVMNNFNALLQACVNGMGLLLTADKFAQPYLDSGKLVSVLPKLNYRQLDIYIFYRAMKYELPKVRAFVDFYSAKLKNI
jgi:DNA-binding transcriptional LysR family regulator